MIRMFSVLLAMAVLVSCSVHVHKPEPKGVPPGHGGTPPGHGGVPPGHGGIPPGQAKKLKGPVVVVHDEPEFAIVVGTDIRVLLDVDADVFLIGSVYYCLHEGIWFKAGHHSGPWVGISVDHLPPGLRSQSPKELKAKAKRDDKHKPGKGPKWNR